MASETGKDQLAVIKIEGMHCHKCERTIQKVLSGTPGVHEVEVDFNSGQASVLFDRHLMTPGQLMDRVNAAGYRAIGYSQGERN